MGEVLVDLGMFALFAIASVSGLLYLTGPKDQPRVDDPRCWCEAFGVRREDCYCVTFEERAE